MKKGSGIDNTDGRKKASALLQATNHPTGFRLAGVGVSEYSIVLHLW